MRTAGSPVVYVSGCASLGGSNLTLILQGIRSELHTAFSDVFILTLLLAVDTPPSAYQVLRGCVKTEFSGVQVVCRWPDVECSILSLLFLHQKPKKGSCHKYKGTQNYDGATLSVLLQVRSHRAFVIWVKLTTVHVE